MKTLPGSGVRAVTELGVVRFLAGKPTLLGVASAPEAFALLLFLLVFREVGLGASSQPSGGTVPSGLFSPSPLPRLSGTAPLDSNNKAGYLQTVDLLT